MIARLSQRGKSESTPGTTMLMPRVSLTGTVFSFALSIALLANSQASWGEEIRRLFESPRALGRGGTFVAAFDSNEASRQNPATLIEADISFQLRPFEGDLFIGENTLDTIDDLLDLSSTSDSFGFLRKFDSKFGKVQYFRGLLSFLSMRFGRFEFSPFAQNASSIEPKSEAIPKMQWESDTLAGLNLSYAFPLMTNLNMGVTLRPFYRLYVKGAVEAMDIIDFLPPSTTEFEDLSPVLSGTGMAMDIGTIWKPSESFRLGLTIQNVGDGGYFAENEKNPPPLRQVISLGVLYRWVAPWFNLDFSYDIQDLENRQEVDFLRLIHWGLEIGTSVFSRDNDFGLLFGINEGYLTYGGYFDLFLFRIDITNYAVEQFILPGQEIDRRWAISAKTSITF